MTHSHASLRALAAGRYGRSKEPVTRNTFPLAAALLVLTGVAACQLQVDAARSHATPLRPHRGAGAVVRPCALSGCIHRLQPQPRATGERGLPDFRLRQDANADRTTRLAATATPEPTRDAVAFAGISTRPHPIVQGYP